MVAAPILSIAIRCSVYSVGSIESVVLTHTLYFDIWARFTEMPLEVGRTLDGRNLSTAK